MFGMARTKSTAFWLGTLVLFLQILGSYSDDTFQVTDDETLSEILREEQREKKEEENAIPQDLGTGVHEAKDLMDLCINAAGPRPLNEVFSPGRTNYATVDDVNGGFCGVTIDSPGIWWWVEGTGDPITVSSCHLQTDIKVKFSIFTGSCGNLECVSGGAEPDFSCPLLKRENDIGEWDTMASAHTFETKIDQKYFVLVQSAEGYGRGEIWLNFREPEVPQNDQCEDAIGPVPRDLTKIENTNIDATVSEVFDYCNQGLVPALYPGTWFQIMGTGEPVTIMACSQYNFDGYAFSVYNGAYCNDMECVEGEYELKVDDPEKCTFGSARVNRPLTKYTFDTRDRDRYWIYVHTARTRAEVPTADFRFWVDDGREGDGSTSGASVIEIADVPEVTRIEREDHNSNGLEKAASGHRSGLSLLVLTVTLMVQGYGIL